MKRRASLSILVLVLLWPNLYALAQAWGRGGSSASSDDEIERELDYAAEQELVLYFDKKVSDETLKSSVGILETALNVSQWTQSRFKFSIEGVGRIIFSKDRRLPEGSGYMEIRIQAPVRENQTQASFLAIFTIFQKKSSELPNIFPIAARITFFSFLKDNFDSATSGVYYSFEPYFFVGRFRITGLNEELSQRLKSFGDYMPIKKSWSQNYTFSEGEKIVFSRQVLLVTGQFFLSPVDLVPHGRIQADLVLISVDEATIYRAGIKKQKPVESNTQSQPPID